MDLILDFRKLNKNSLPLVGGKNASLGEMINADIRVPPGFAVTTNSYAVFMEQAGINDTIFSLLADLDSDNIEALNQAAEKVQEMIRTAAIPDDVQKTIREGYALLCKQCEVDPLPVAVRSSATAEDLPTASFAGQQDTYLWITGADRVIENVRKCWSSLYTPRAISYRVKNEFPHEKVLISVGCAENGEFKRLPA